nr:lanC-like protein GCL1 [Ipomoea trifida]
MIGKSWCNLQVAQEKALHVGPEEGGFGMSYDLLYGRADFLWAALLIKQHLGSEAVPSETLMPMARHKVLGAHGLAGILNVLLHFPLSEDGVEDVKGTLRYMTNNRFPHIGNYPVSEGKRDKLVQWCHGATGIGITLCKASQV